MEYLFAHHFFFNSRGPHNLIKTRSPYAMTSLLWWYVSWRERANHNLHRSNVRRTKSSPTLHLCSHKKK